MKKYFGPADRERYGLPKGGRPVENKKGLRYGRLVCLRYIPPAEGGGRSRWECQCDCGTVKVVSAKGLTDGDVTSCGCRHKDVAGKRTRAAATRKRRSLREAACLWQAGLWSDRDFFAYLKERLKIRNETLQWAKQQRASARAKAPLETARNYRRRQKLLEERNHDTV